MERISSRQNAVAKQLRALAHAGSTGDEILLDGPHLLEEALGCGVDVRLAVFAENARTDRLSSLADRTERAGIRTFAAADALFSTLSPVREPSGVVAVARRPSVTLDEALERAPQLVLVLDGVQDPGNVGAIIRTAEACGATAVIVTLGSADPFGWKALRGAMGSSLRLPVVARAAISATLPVLRASGIRIVATVPRSGRAPAELDLLAPTAIVLGGEGAGLADGVLQQTDERLSVPMRPPVESLNVATAAAIVLYEAFRQRSDVTLR